ncbi:MAG: class II aldolase/adducin family protein [Candidatus Aminicenantes bacterium]|nr:class II aldolase/adducin family protein [Candidatus Aminicenantes bacterium]
MGNSRESLIDAIVEVCRQVAAKGWVANHDGNASVRLDDTLLATPTAVSKADVSADMIITLDQEGKKLQGSGNPFSEIKLHLAAYRARPEIQAVLHAHPPLATARGLAGGDFAVPLPEAVVSIGDSIPVMPYAFPGAAENDSLVAAALERSDVFMMAGNGVLACGSNIKEAFLRMELLEHLLRIDHYGRNMKPFRTLSAADKAKLLEKRAQLGLGPLKAQTASAQTADASQAPSLSSEWIRDLIVEELKKILSEKK